MAPRTERPVAPEADATEFLEAGSARLSGCVLCMIDGRRSLFRMQGESQTSHVEIKKHMRNTAGKS
jgi:hypothetical protein